MKKYAILFLSLFIMHNVYADIIDEDMVGGCELDNFTTVNNVANLIPVYDPSIYTCSSGQFLPANTTSCQSCPSGYTCAGGDMTFNETNLSGVDYNSPISNSTQYTCSENFLHSNNNNVSNLIPVYDPSVYTCSAGQFLPANAITCSSCPTGYTCVGGNMTFNEDNLSGIDYNAPIVTSTQNTCSENFLHVNNNNVSNLIPIYEPNVHNCPAGQYLPANVDECTQCPANSYCPGGTLTFNETTAQGINPCPNNQTSLPGSSSVDQCKTVNLTWVSNGETYTTSTCTINGLITLPPAPPARPGYTFNGWTVQKNNE